MDGPDTTKNIYPGNFVYKGIIIAIYIIITLVCIHEHHPRIKQILLCSCWKLFHTSEYPNFVIFYEFIFVNPVMLYQSFWFWIIVFV